MKVLVLYTGGLPFTEEFSAQAAAEKVKAYLELQLVAKVEIQILHHIAGADVSFSLAADLGQAIMSNYAKFDGFVIMHSIDNAIYTANLLAFQLTNLGKPVIFTGTTLSENFFNFPGHFSSAEQLAYREMSLRTSLVTSVQLATLNCRGVLLAYGPHIVQAVRANEHLTSDQAGFVAWPDGEVATVRFGIELNAHTPTRHQASPEFNPRYSTHITTLLRQPDLTIPPLPENTQAVLMTAYQDQALPSQLEFPANLLTVVTGNTIQTTALPPHLLLLPALPLVTAQAKLMAGLGRTTSTEELKAYLLKNQVGEFGGQML